MAAERARARCGSCADFLTDPQAIEQQTAGLPSLGSAHGANRGDDGFCVRHDRHVTARAHCFAWHVTNDRDR